MKNQVNDEEKIYGIYQGFLKPEEVDTLDEIDIWKKIDNLGAFIFWGFHDMNKPWGRNISAQELIEAQYALEYLVYHTKKYGVEFSREPISNEHVERSESYNAWYGFWKQHFDSMNQDDYNAFLEDKFNGKDISKYMPCDTWKNHYQKVKTIQNI